MTVARFVNGYEHSRRIPCAKRLDTGNWCLLDDGHNGACMGMPARYGPSSPPHDRDRYPAFRIEVARKWDPKTAEAWNAEVEGRKASP